jgi:hypothetical protein
MFDRGGGVQVTSLHAPGAVLGRELIDAVRVDGSALALLRKATLRPRIFYKVTASALTARTLFSFLAVIVSERAPEPSPCCLVTHRLVVL